jgi:hypothetical protein
VSLQFLNRGRQLRDRRADIRKFDDVGVRRFDQFAEFCQSISLLLLVGQFLGETGKNPRGE